MKKDEPPPLGVFWECSQPACGFRFVEAPLRGHPPPTRPCPRCGAPAVVEATVPPPPPRSPTGEPPPPQVAVLLDNLRSAYNVGAAFRIADAAGLRHLYLAGITPSPKHPGVGKTALGAQRAVPWSQHINGVKLVATLQAQGWAVWALETGSTSRPLGEWLNTGVPSRLVLVVGNEVAGVDPAILQRADAVAALPMWGIKASLNVATALAAAIYRVRATVSSSGASP